MLEIRKCVCGKEFEARSHNRKYCNEKCRKCPNNRLCVDCGEYIPTYSKLDNKAIRLTSRIRCLKCKPWKKRKIRTEDERIQDNKIKCSKYYKENKEELNRKNYQRSKKARKNAKDFLVKLTNGCQLCGYNKTSNNIAFHHLRDKEFNVSAREFQFSKKRVAKELKKCIAICHNCHGEIHVGIINDKNLIESKNKEFQTIVSLWASNSAVRVGS